MIYSIYLLSSCLNFDYFWCRIIFLIHRETKLYLLLKTRQWVYSWRMMGMKVHQVPGMCTYRCRNTGSSFLMDKILETFFCKNHETIMQGNRVFHIENWNDTDIHTQYVHLFENWSKGKSLLQNIRRYKCKISGFFNTYKLSVWRIRVYHT